MAKNKQAASVKLTDNTELVRNATDEAILRALEAVGVTMEGYAKLLAPVDTGRLRNSITHAIAGEKAAISTYRSNDVHADTPATQRAGTAGKPVEVTEHDYKGRAGGKAGKSVYVGTNVEYAPYVEMGTTKMAPQPFLRPAATEHIDEYKRLFENELRKP